MAPAVILDSRFHPAIEPFDVIVTDVSQEGIGIMHPDLIDGDRIALEFNHGRPNAIQVVVKLVHDQPVDQDFYEIGGQFFVRLGSVADMTNADLAKALGA